MSFLTVGNRILIWDILLREWACINCGWREFETPDREPETQKSL